VHAGAPVSAATFGPEAGGRARARRRLPFLRRDPAGTYALAGGLVFDSETGEQVIWLKGRCPLPGGSVIEIMREGSKPSYDAVVCGIRLIAGSPDRAMTLCLHVVKTPTSYSHERFAEATKRVRVEFPPLP